MKGLIKLNKENCSSIEPDPWYAWYHHSHPTLFERISRIKKLICYEESESESMSSEYSSILSEFSL